MAINRPIHSPNPQKELGDYNILSTIVILPKSDVGCGGFRAELPPRPPAGFKLL